MQNTFRENTMKRFIFLISALAVLCLISLVYSPVRTENFICQLGNGASIGFQHDTTYLTLTVSSGSLNSSTNSLTLNVDDGRFQFLNNNSLVFTPTFNVTRVQVTGDQGNEVHIIQSGETVTVNANDVVLIEWWNTLEPWVPFMFILGMVGLCAMFGGTLHGVKEIQKGKLQQGAVTIAIYLPLGFGLFIAWLTV